MYLIILLIIFVLVFGVYIFMQLPQFGSKPSGARQLLLERSPNYKKGQFQNLSNTPAIAEDTTYIAVMREFFFGKSKRNVPSMIIPSQKTDLLGLDPAKDVFVWFGHSSYFMQISGKKILVDPVFSGYASPLSFTTKSFKGADIYAVDEIPPIDYLFISHDHYDHLDHRTLKKLRPRIGKVITGLGVGAHLERWGFDPKQIMEKDWNEEVTLDPGFTVHTAPARHFSGRGFKRNGTLWLSFVLYTPDLKIYLGGDSGYDNHFKKIGEQYGPFDIAILEDGQYDKNWKYIHMMPEEAVAAAIDLRAKKLIPVHWSKFSLSVHAWDDPIIRIDKEARLKNLPLIHPMIGEAVQLKDPAPSKAWWTNLG
jgi:L-ascorbate metabolism protein UlaG (beta-lactamase superfamily)